jgi:hypothetical protein
VLVVVTSGASFRAALRRANSLFSLFFIFASFGHILLQHLAAPTVTSE